jgi:hypothetical protein
MKDLDQKIFDIAVNAGMFIRCVFIASVAAVVIMPVVIFL